jgi:ribosomal protein L3 glutamine methyltransferase
VNVGQSIQKIAVRLESANLYYGHGTDNAVDEAAWLVLHSIDAQLDGHFEDWDLPVDSQQAELIEDRVIERIKTGKPLAYILGSAWFAGLEFNVDSSVLVPRSPIAELIQEQFHPWINSSEISSVLDMCTGGGCIAIAMAVHMPWLSVDAADISESALSVAGKNVHKHAVGSRLRLIQSDLFNSLKDSRYDLIVTNPPYVSTGSMSDLPKEYQAEPELGLVSGADGLDDCLQIMLQSVKHLEPDGVLICEVGESEQRLKELLPEVPFLWLEFSEGGCGVFLLSRDQLENSQERIRVILKDRKYVT